MSRVRSGEVVKACCRLAREFGPVLPASYRGRPLDELILTILSQSTTDTNTARAFRSLRRRFPRWELAAAASATQIAAAIRHGGLANVKSKVIRRALRIVREREGRLSLARLTGMPDAEVMAYLMSIPGVGVKTASCVLMFSLGRPVFPVDTHVYRVTRRLGWLPRRTPVEEASALLKPMIPDCWVLSLHLYLIWHGRKTCVARGPRCGECVIRRHCQHGWRRG